VRRHALLDVVLDRLDDDDRIVHDEPDREHEPKRESVFTEKPNTGNSMKVPMRETGTARSGSAWAAIPAEI